MNTKHLQNCHTVLLVKLAYKNETELTLHRKYTSKLMSKNTASVILTLNVLHTTFHSIT